MAAHAPLRGGAPQLHDAVDPEVTLDAGVEGHLHRAAVEQGGLQEDPLAPEEVVVHPEVAGAVVIVLVVRVLGVEVAGQLEGLGVNLLEEIALGCGHCEEGRRTW